MNTSLTAPTTGGETEGHFITEPITSDVSNIDPEIQIFDLYTVGHNSIKTTVQPFIHQLNINSGISGAIPVWANFDDGALANAMSIAKFNTIKHRLGYCKPSTRLLRMADGSIVKPKAVWEGRMEIGGVEVMGSFEVFDSRGSWEFLLGKPLLTAFHAIHEYTHDTVSIENNGSSTTLVNQINSMNDARNSTSHNRTKEWKKRKDSKDAQMTDIAHVDTTEPHGETTNAIHISETQDEHTTTATEIEIDILKEDDNLYTRHTNPFKKERVDEILRQVTIGPDLTDEERGCVQKFIANWADIFALSVNEVKQVNNAVHHLDIPPDTTFSTKTGQKPLTPPQRKYLYESIDTMLKAGIIEQCLPDQVKCVSPTTLAQKVHSNPGLNLEELQHRLNDQCIAHGFEQTFNLPPRSAPTPDDESTKNETKWRICQNFAQINKVTKIAPMPQGDIRAKQQRLSGHRWVSGFDFAAGFYAVTVDPESRPYTAFYVEGRGYFWYKRMPFGLTGAPSTFSHMTGTRMHEPIADGTMELFVDDGGTAANTFTEMMEKLTRIFTLIRAHGLSLSASKCELFMTTMVFAGASVGPKGVQPDLSKLTAIVNWKIPEDALALVGFLGLTGWF